MSHRLPISRLILAVWGAYLIVSTARGADAYTIGGSEATPLQVSIKRGELIGHNQVQRAFVTSGTNEFLMVVPGGARASLAKPDQLTIVPTDYGYYLSFRIIAFASTEASSSNYYRDLILTRYPGAKIIETSSEGAGGHAGPAFDLQWTTTGGVDQLVRVAFIPSAAGVLEFTLIVDEKKSAEGQSNFRDLLMNFRSNESGRLQVAFFPVDS